MTISPLPLAFVVASAFILGTASTGALAATSPAATPAKKAAPAPSRAKKAVKPVKPVEPPPPPEADEAQLSAAEKVYYGVYECEFKMSIDIVASPKFKGYVDVKHQKSAWVMKPVLSSTGAIRLEDVHNETLMVQISSKSMLLNVKTGHRIVDECVSARQRELIDAARAKAAEAAEAAKAAAAASAASAAAVAGAASAVAATAPVARPTEPAAAMAASGAAAVSASGPGTK